MAGPWEKYQQAAPADGPWSKFAKPEGDRVIYREGDVRIVERPDGRRALVSPSYSTTDPERIAKVLEGASAGELSRQSIDESVIAANPSAARLSQFVRGIPFVGSYVDEAIGAVAGEDAELGTRALQGAMQRQRPWQTLGLNLAGGATAAVGAAAAAPQAMTAAATKVLGRGPMLSQAARGAAIGAVGGAVEGGVYGTGEGTDRQSRAEEGKRGAQFGAAAGGLLGAAAPYAAKGAENLIGYFNRSDARKIASDLSISQDAAKVIRQTFEMGGDMDDAMRAIQRAGDEGMLADAGDAAAALLDAAGTSGPGPAGTVRRAVDSRATRSAEKMDTGLTGLLGQPAEGPRTAVANIQRSTAPARRTAYQAAFSTPIDYASGQGRKIEDVLDRVDPNTLIRAVGEANEEMRSLGLKNEQIMAMIDDAGKVTFREMPNVRQLNEIKKALEATARGAREAVTGVETQQSLRAARLATELRDALVDATGGDEGAYKRALRLGGDTIKEREAFQLGESLLSPRTRIEDVTMALGDNPSQAQIQAARQGLRTRVEEVVGNVRRIPSDPNIDARQMVGALREMGSDNARRKMQIIMDDEADALFNLLDEASASAELRANVAGNSRTAIRQATTGMIDETTAPGMIGRAAKGDPLEATKTLVQAITGMTDEYTESQRQRIFSEIARALTQKQGQSAQAALRMIQGAMDGQKLTDAQVNTLSRLLAATLYSSAAPTAGRELMGP